MIKNKNLTLSALWQSRKLFFVEKYVFINELFCQQIMMNVLTVQFVDCMVFV